MEIMFYIKYTLNSSHDTIYNFSLSLHIYIDTHTHTHIYIHTHTYLCVYTHKLSFPGSSTVKHSPAKQETICNAEDHLQCKR